MARCVEAGTQRPAACVHVQPSFGKPSFAEVPGKGIDDFYSAIAATAYRVYLKCLNEQVRAGVTREATNEAGTRFTIKISKAAAAKLCVDNELIHDCDSLHAIKAATVAVCKRFGSCDRFVVPSSVPEGSRGCSACSGILPSSRQRSRSPSSARPTSPVLPPPV